MNEFDGDGNVEPCNSSSSSTDSSPLVLVSRNVLSLSRRRSLSPISLFSSIPLVQTVDDTNLQGRNSKKSSTQTSPKRRIRVRNMLRQQSYPVFFESMKQDTGRRTAKQKFCGRVFFFSYCSLYTSSSARRETAWGSKCTSIGVDDGQKH